MFADGISNAVVVEALLRSLSLSLVVALISGVAGCLVAWLVTRSDIGGGGRFQASSPCPTPSRPICWEWPGSCWATRPSAP